MAGVLRGGCGGSSTRILYSLAFSFSSRLCLFFFWCICYALLSLSRYAFISSFSLGRFYFLAFVIPSGWQVWASPRYEKRSSYLRDACARSGKKGRFFVREQRNERNFLQNDRKNGSKGILSGNSDCGCDRTYGMWPITAVSLRLG